MRGSLVKFLNKTKIVFDDSDFTTKFNVSSTFINLS